MTLVSDRLESVWQDISRQIREHTSSAFSCRQVHPVSGGCINTAYIIEDGGSRYFVKLNAAHRLPMFEAEADGLRELAAARALRVPAPVCWGQTGEQAWLVLEDLGDMATAASADWARLGRGLALMHRHRGKSYGWRRDNTIGATEQKNGWHDNWVEFVRGQRLGFQLDLAAGNGYGKRLNLGGRRLLENLDFFFAGYAPEASLLHGDLWSGNVGFRADGEPVLFDPAVYYGDREADIAMSELFGGFAADFYRAYENEWPLHHGYRNRRDLYNLYHLLNHLNLFGHAYLDRCESTIARLLACLR